MVNERSPGRGAAGHKAPAPEPKPRIIPRSYPPATAPVVPKRDGSGYAPDPAWLIGRGLALMLKADPSSRAAFMIGLTEELESETQREVM